MSWVRIPSAPLLAMFNLPVNIVSKVYKESDHTTVQVGERVKACITPYGEAVLARDSNIKFGHEEFDLFIRDEEYETLLGY